MTATERARRAAGGHPDPALGNGRKSIDSDLTVKRRKVSDDVTDALLAMIRSGELSAGSRLPPERDLATRFGVSRTTLRDAIRGLELLGYLKVRQGDGTVVHRPGAETLAAPFRSMLEGQPQRAIDLLEFRRIVEPEVAALAAARRDVADIAELRLALAQQRRMTDAGLQLTDEDLSFHQLIARIAGNLTVLNVLATLQALLREFRAHMLTANRPYLALEQHAAIVDAIAAGDAPTARRAVLDHLEAVERSIVQGQGTRPEEEHPR